MLGVATGFLGRSAILICTEAVERTVHQHLDDQILWSADDHPDIARALIEIQKEELEHLQSARASAPEHRLISMRILDQLIAAATEVLIWLSTYGASARVARRLRA